MRRAVCDCSIKQSYLKTAGSLQLYQKETRVQMFYCEFYEIDKNNFFAKHFRTTASEI